MGAKEAAVKGATGYAKNEFAEEVDQALDKAIDKGPLDRMEDKVDDATEDLGRKVATRTIEAKK